MTLPWHCIEIARGCETKAPTELLRRGMRVFVPVEPLEKITQTFVELRLKLRFPPYIFAQLPGGVNVLGDDDARRAGIMNVLCAGGVPSRVPERAIEAMRAYVPLPKKVATVHRYREGQQVQVYTSGVPQQGVFIGYHRGRDRAVVQIWILGAERIAPVAVSQLEGTVSV